MKSQTRVKSRAHVLQKKVLCKVHTSFYFSRSGEREIVLVSAEPNGDRRIEYTELDKKPNSVQYNVSTQRRARQEFGSDRLT